MKDWLLGFKVSLEGGGIMWVYMYHRSGSEGCTIPGCIPHRPHAEATPKALKMYAE